MKLGATPFLASPCRCDLLSSALLAIFYKHNLTEFKSQLSISRLLLQEENNFERVVVFRSNGITLLEQRQTIVTVLISPDV